MFGFDIFVLKTKIFFFLSVRHVSYAHVFYQSVNFIINIGIRSTRRSKYVRALKQMLALDKYLFNIFGEIYDNKQRTLTYLILIYQQKYHISKYRLKYTYLNYMRTNMRNTNINTE